MKHALTLLLCCCTLFLSQTAQANTSTDSANDQLLSVILSLKNDITCHGANNGLAVVAGVGGVPAYAYVWSNGTVGPINANLSAGVYTVTCTDLLGATASLSVTINEPAQLVVDVSAQTNINCLNTTGAATVTTSGGTGISTVLWSNGVSGLTVSNLNAGVYIATATDTKGCIATETINIEVDLELPHININLSGDLQLDCNSQQISLDASASASGSGISYLWTSINGHIVSGSNSNTAIVDAAGEYKLVITDAGNGCTSTQNVQVTASLTLPTAHIQAGANVDLQLDCLTPQITLSGSGSATGSNISYLWLTLNGHIVAGANTLDDVVVDAEGTYTLQVTDNTNGCSSSLNVNVTADFHLPSIAIAAGANVDLQIDCLSPTVQLDATASASGSGITYLWTTINGHIVAGGNSDLATVDAAGTYILTISDSNNGCSASLSVEVTVDLQLPTISIAAAASLDCAHSSLVLDASASSHGNDFIYLWTTVSGHIISGENTLTPTVNAAGTYILVISNQSNNCSATANVVVTGQPTLNISLSGLVHVSCFGALTGAVNINVTGGTGPYTYAWSNGMSSASVTGLAAGLYFATVSDAQGCKGVVSVQITQPNQMTANVNTTPASNGSANDGTATISVTGGAAPYTYAWSNGMSGASVSGLAAGTYTVVIRDASNCQITVTVVIGNTQGCSLSVTTTIQNADCNQSNGKATAIAINATGTTTYTWSNGMSGASVSNLAAGTYIVTVSDAQGCVAVGAAIITDQDHVAPVVITKNVSITLDASCNASLTVNMVNNGSYDACGSITLSLNTNIFNSGQIGAQTVVLTATDQSGNSASATAIVTVVDDTPATLHCPDDMMVSTGGGVVNYATPTLEDNCGAPNATLVLTGGFASGSIFPSGATVVSYVALGLNGFVASCNFTVTVSGGLSTNFDVSSPSCPGSSDGSITVNVNGGSGNYTYLWINAFGQTTQTASGLPAGNYTVIIVDDAGNVTIQTVNLPDPAGISISMTLVTDYCNGTGAIDVTVTGGTPPYTYAWYDGNGTLFATTEDLDSIPSGNYNLIVTDANGCTISTGIITVDLTSGVVNYEYDSAGKISISPNPTADGHITLDLNLPETSPVRVEMYNANGQQVGNVVQAAEMKYGQIPLNLHAFAPGHYVVKVITTKHAYTKKVILLN